MAEKKLKALPESTAQELKQIDSIKHALSPEDAKEFEEYKQFLSSQYEMPGITASDVVGGIAKGLDYAGGLVRGAGGMAMGAVTPEEYLAAAKGEAQFPDSAEIMQRMGVPEGATLSDAASFLYENPDDPNSDRWYVLNKGGALDPSMRGAVGTAIDIATDPLTYLSMGGTVAGKTIAKKSARQASRGLLGNPMKNSLEDALQAAKSVLESRGAGAVNLVGAPIRNVSEYLGNAFYRHGVKPLDKESVRMGKEPISDLLMQRGIHGSSEGIEEAMLRRSDELRDQARALAREADTIDPVKQGMYGEASGGVNMAEAMVPARAAVGSLEGVVPHATVKDAMEQSIQDLFNLGNVSYEKAIQNKSALYDNLPGSTYAVNAYTAPGGRVRAQQARGIREAVEQRANRAQPGLGDQIRDVNDEWGRYLTVKDTAQSMAGRGGMRVSPGQLAAAAGVAAPGPWAMGKTVMDVTRATPVSTTTGYWLNRLGRSPLMSVPDAIVRQEFIESRRDRSPWRLMEELR